MTTLRTAVLALAAASTLAVAPARANDSDDVALGVAAGVLGGAVLLGVLSNTAPDRGPAIPFSPHVDVSNPSAHVGWCESTYRSYRASDNTFQPYHGPRKQCRSPYSF